MLKTPDLQLGQCDWLIVGFRAGRDAQFDLISLCRRYDGAVIFREGEVMVVEVAGYSEVVDELLARLPRTGVTHLWRSGKPTGSEPTEFLRHLTVQQNVHSETVCVPLPGVRPPAAVSAWPGP